MKTTTANAGLKVKASIKAGGMPLNHNRNGLKVKAGIKAGEIVFLRNHSARLLLAR